jgi:hypothetical protein
MVSIVLIAPFSPAGIGILPSSHLVPAISSFPIFVHNNDACSFRRPAIFLATFSPRLAIAVLDCATFTDLSFSSRFVFRLSADGEY